MLYSTWLFYPFESPKYVGFKPYFLILENFQENTLVAYNARVPWLTLAKERRNSIVTRPMFARVLITVYRICNEKNMSGMNNEIQK